MGIQTFARFVPEAVVRNIIKGGWAHPVDVVIGRRIWMEAKNSFKLFLCVWFKASVEDDWSETKKFDFCWKMF